MWSGVTGPGCRTVVAGRLLDAVVSPGSVGCRIVLVDDPVAVIGFGEIVQHPRCLGVEVGGESEGRVQPVDSGVATHRSVLPCRQPDGLVEALGGVAERGDRLDREACRIVGVGTFENFCVVSVAVLVAVSGGRVGAVGVDLGPVAEGVAIAVGVVGAGASELGTEVGIRRNPDLRQCCPGFALVSAASWAQHG